jgi:hypothetical protein
MRFKNPKFNLTFKQSIAIDLGSCIGVTAVLTLASSPWWVYVAVLVFGICQRLDAKHSN